jgi:hypothetical protein
LASSRRAATIRLEPFDREHLDGLGSMLGDPEMLRFTRIPEPVPADFEGDLVRAL